jgi:hypothetical protein
MRTARSRSSAGYGFTGFFIVSIAPFSQMLGPPGNPARFSSAWRDWLAGAMTKGIARPVNADDVAGLQ